MSSIIVVQLAKLVAIWIILDSFRTTHSHTLIRIRIDVVQCTPKKVLSAVEFLAMRRIFGCMVTLTRNIVVYGVKKILKALSKKSLFVCFIGLWSQKERLVNKAGYNFMITYFFAPQLDEFIVDEFWF